MSIYSNKNKCLVQGTCITILSLLGVFQEEDLFLFISLSVLNN